MKKKFFPIESDIVDSHHPSIQLYHDEVGASFQLKNYSII